MIILLIALVITSGLLAGFFFAWWCSCMVGLRGVRDVTFVETMQHINAVLPNPQFIGPFLAPVILSPIAGWLLLTDGQVTAGIWAAASALLSIISFGITASQNVPLNQTLAQADLENAGAAREAYEGPWIRWNTIRTLTSTLALVASVLALVTFD